ncbi:S1 RNA binding domain-containing protein [Paenibacillus sp. yr247]|uniref:S1 RNA-binding domain-containing protein n=1 Tax=Paenibacillus sp. yr247 TaxID=1761880 RepID=UPI000884EAFE|nr:S1 RNA-binding domain-containing protein [Paenibacillus sp. yr247]SDO15542.1 S1 RNA binding domain-containing protein [Paenibacillus sp. yr247]
MNNANAAVLELLRDSMKRRFVQYGVLENIREVRLANDTSEELLLINFNGVTVYCRKADFVKRELKSYSGFLQTSVPFIVKNITPDGHVIVNRIEALPIVSRAFIRNVSEGDIVTGTVTGVTANNVVFVDIQGVPCLIPPQEWDSSRPINLREFVKVGTELDLQVLTIQELPKKESEGESEVEGVTDNKSWEFGYRVRLSRKAVMSEEISRIWDRIEDHYTVGDSTVAKIVGFAQGMNSYFLELPKGLVIVGNLQNNLRRQYGGGLPPGLKVHVTIERMNKEQRRGKAKIFKLDPTLQSVLRRPNAFNPNFS